jgi:hypothetical protein
MLINKKHENSIKKVAAYPGANTDSDCNPLVGTLKSKRKRIPNKDKKKAYDISSLIDTEKM